MAEAAKAMRKIQNRIDKRVARSKGRAQARTQYYGEYEPERADFPCVYLCGTCGYIVDDDALEVADENDDERDDPQPCPACEDTHWYDLAIEPLADRVRDMEAKERNEAPTWVTVLSVGATLGILVAASMGLVATGYGAYTPYVVMSALVLLPLAYFALPRPLSVLVLQGRERPPHRWHEPLPLPGEDESPSRTLDDRPARAAGDTLTAPISGEECLAYQVSVLFDTPGDARPPEWAIQEQRAEDVQLGDDLTVDADSVYLESPAELVDTTGDEEIGEALAVQNDQGERYDEIKKFLRQRGLFITEGEYHYYEARLEPGDRVDVADFDGETYVMRHASAEEADELPA